MKLKLRMLLSLLALTFGFAGLANAEVFRNSAKYNLTNGVGLKGFDPVAVFPEGGGAAAMGQPNLRTDHLGVTYLFVSPQNMELFQQNPDKYEPTYGGWCAYAMANGSQVDIQPQIFTIHGNRAHFFVSGRAKQTFDRDVAGHEQNADGHWKVISNEDPRL